MMLCNLELSASARHLTCQPQNQWDAPGLAIARPMPTLLGGSGERRSTSLTVSWSSSSHAKQSR